MCKNRLFNDALRTVSYTDYVVELIELLRELIQRYSL